MSAATKKIGDGEKSFKGGRKNFWRRAASGLSQRRTSRSSRRGRAGGPLASGRHLLDL